jgi:AMIN domain-containing protein
MPEVEDLVLGATMAEVRDFPTEAHCATVDYRRPKLGKDPRAGGRVNRVFQLLTSVYAVAMLVITLRVYTRGQQHPGFALFFVACTASFYIICYNALSIEADFKLWLELHYPALRQFSIGVAIVLATAPVGILYLVKPVDAAKPTPPQTAKALVAASSPAGGPTVVQAANVGNSGHVILASSNGIVVLKDIRYSSGPSSTTVAIDVDENVHYQINRLTEPYRIYLDLPGSKLDRALSGRKFQVNDSLLRAIRVAEHQGAVTRIALETHHFSDYRVTPEPNSHRLLIELRNPALK